MTGLAQVDHSLREAAVALDMKPGQILRQVELPLAMPVIIAGICTATVWTVGTATLATPVGHTCLGNYIFMGLQTRHFTAVLFGCAAAAVLAISLDALVGSLEKSLRRNGLPVKRRDGLGSTVLFDALAAGQVDVYVDYNGTLWANHMKQDGGGEPSRVLSEVSGWLEEAHGIVCLGPMGFENAYALAMRRERAAATSLSTVTDLASVAPDLVIGGDYEFFGRPEWRQLRQAYHLSFASRASFDSTFMYEAEARGEVDVIAAFSSDGRITALDLIVLDEPLNILPPYDAVILLSARAAANTPVRSRPQRHRHQSRGTCLGRMHHSSRIGISVLTQAAGGVD